MLRGGELIMTKMDLIAAVAAKTGSTKTDAARSLDAMLDAITADLRKGGKVTITGFGTFERRERQPRMGRNPQTGAPMHIAGSKVVHFKAGKGLKDSVK